MSARPTKKSPAPKSAAAAAPKAAVDKKHSRSARAGVLFPVGRFHRQLRQGQYARRVGVGAPVYLAAVLEYLTAELVELAGNVAKDNNKARIVPRHVLLAVRNDHELNTLLADVTIANAGLLPNIDVANPKKAAATDTA